MKKISFCTIGNSSALTHAKNTLISWGYEVSKEINETTTHILLPVPSMDETGNIRGASSVDTIITQLHHDVTILGGHLPTFPYKCIDLLKDEYYLAENAAITAHCAIRLALNYLQRTIKNLPVLVIGWGRIGKCLAELLRSLGGNTTVAVRNKTDCAILHALGYKAIMIDEIKPSKYGLIFNTAPAPVMHCDSATNNTILIDLASKKGIIGDNVLWERGLPNRLAPESSGILIAKTALRYALAKE